MTLNTTLNSDTAYNFFSFKPRTVIPSTRIKLYMLNNSAGTLSCDCTVKKKHGKNKQTMQEVYRAVSTSRECSSVTAGRAGAGRPQSAGRHPARSCHWTLPAKS